MSPSKAKLGYLSQEIWGKGLIWAFENELFMVVDLKEKICKKSEEPVEDARVLAKMLGHEMGGESESRKGDSHARLYVLAGIRKMEFPCERHQIYLRSHYFEAYRRIKQALSLGDEGPGSAGIKGVLLRGNPGIGKTVFLTFALVVRLLLALPTAYQPQTFHTSEKPSVYLCDEDCSSIESRKVTTNQDGNQEVLALCDEEPTRILLGPEAERRWPILYASSPNPSKYAKYIKSCSPYKFYMDIWKHEELEILNSVLNIWSGFFSPAEICDLFNRYSPSPRFLVQIQKSLLTTEEFLEDYDKEVIAKAKPIIKNATDTLKDEAFWFEASSIIAVIRPRARGNTDRFTDISPSFRFTIPTTYIYGLVATAAASVNQSKTKHFFRMVRGIPELHGAAGTAWEGYVKTRLSACEDELVNSVRLLPPTAKGLNGANATAQSFNFALGTGIVSFVDGEDLAVKLASLSVDEIRRKLFVPVQKNFPTADFLFFRIIKKNKNGGYLLHANLLQATASPTHSLKAIGLVVVANAIPAALKDLTTYPPQIITLVPDITTFRKMPQEMEYPVKSSKEAASVKAAEPWLRNVHQYVATCPNWAKAWGRTRVEEDKEQTARLTAETYAEQIKKLNQELNKRDEMIAMMELQITELRERLPIIEKAQSGSSGKRKKAEVNDGSDSEISKRGRKAKRIGLPSRK